MYIHTQKHTCIHSYHLLIIAENTGACVHYVCINFHWVIRSGIYVDMEASHLGFSIHGISCHTGLNVRKGTNRHSQKDEG